MATSTGKRRTTETPSSDGEHRTTPPPPEPQVPVVGIGASAGGVQALETFFRAVPTDLGVAFVVIVHLSPEHQSELAAILGRFTSMPSLPVNSVQPLRPNHVYVISPDRRLEITDHSVAALPFEEPRGKRAPIDSFFRSLAAEHGDGFAIILSGGGSDGALGVRATKEAGGIVLVQDPRDALHDGMPRSALATGVVDVVLPVHDLALKLGELVRNKPHLISELPSQGDELNDNDEHAFKQILKMIRSRTGQDFSQYKRSTVLRRLVRRMHLRGVAELSAYHDYLSDNATELRALHDDLLISVTSFFRDPDAWVALEREVIPALLKTKSRERPIRAWVAGCATGEEAYSLAIVMLEQIERMNASLEVVIFASDADEHSLATARHGLYPSAIVADVSDDRLRKYFRKVGDRYQVSQAVRECVTFASHDLLRDPPFSALDLVTCRNVMIYLNRSVQERLSSVFCYACRPDGYLFLGMSETTDDTLFRPIDKRYRIFRAREAVQLRLPTLPDQFVAKPQLKRAGVRPGAMQPWSAVTLHRELLETTSPPSLVVDAQRHVINLSETAGRFLRPRGGPLARDVTELVRPELQLELRSRLARAFEKGERGVSPPVDVSFEEVTRRVSMFIAPSRRKSDDEQYALVVFLEGPSLGKASAEAEVAGSDHAVLALREQMLDLEQQMEVTLDDHQLANEELRSANEELQSLNEEYRSTAEELETSKEELQSINEELQTVNAELKVKLEEVSRTNDDLENLMAASDIGTLFLDRALRIHRFTPRITDVFNVRVSDYGRFIGDFTHRLHYQELIADAEQVLANLIPRQTRARSEQGKTYVIRLQPYRTRQDVINGVVVTFVDVTDLTEAEDKLRKSELELSTELAASTRLYEVVTRAVAAQSSQQALDENLAASTQLLRADLATLHLLDVSSGALKLAAKRGGAELSDLELQQLVADDAAVYEEVVRTRMPHVIAGSSQPRPGVSVHRALKVHPLIGDDAAIYGVLATHYRGDRQFSERDRRVLGTLARQAANLVARWRNEDSLQRLNEQLLEQADVLRELDTRKGEFLAMLAHELRNPLAAISGALLSLDAHVRASEMPQDDERSRMLAILHRQSRHVARMIEDLLDITRINHGKVQLVRRVVDLRETVAQAVEAYRVRIGALETNIELHLPEEAVCVDADIDRILQIVDNLLSNAQRYSEPGGLIRVHVERDGATALLRVCDHGRGMPPEVLARVFEPFFQAKDRRHSSGGLGLGLAVVQSFVELHGGRITAKSDGDGQGCEFIVQLPIVQASAAPRASTQVPRVSRQILVVDDQADVADALGGLLRSLGHRVHLAYGAGEALALTRRERPEIAIVDIEMPEMSGYDLASRLRAESAELRLIAMSAYDPAKLGAALERSAFERFLPKPPDIDSLIRVLTSAEGPHAEN